MTLVPSIALGTSQAARLIFSTLRGVPSRRLLPELGLFPVGGMPC